MAERPDPFETLRQHPEAGAVDSPLPAAEVRARGDRMRRRRTTFRAVAAAAAVAVVTTGGVAIGGQLSSAPAPLPPATQLPSPEPSGTVDPSPALRESDPPRPVSWVTEIPEGFPLEDGLPTRSIEVQWTRSSDERHPFAWDPCHLGAEQPSLGARVDWRSVQVSYPAGGQARQLALFADDTAAERVFDDYVLGSVADCGIYHYEDGVSEDRWQLLPVQQRADVSGLVVAVNQAWTSDMRMTPATHYVVAHVGNALLISAVDGEFGATDENTDDVDRQARATADALIAEMCVFSSDGCFSAAGDERSEEAEDAAAETATHATFGPDGFAGVELGMSLEEANETGAEGEPFHGGDCAPLIWHTEGGSVEMLGTIQRDVGIISLRTSRRASTPEGIDFESTLEEVRATYPGGEWFDPTYVTPVPGHDDRRYAFTFAGGEATGILSMSLFLQTQDCIANVSGTSSAP